jgi:type II secretion system protein N
VKKLLIVLFAAAVLSLGVWPIAIPETMIKNIIEDSLKDSGLTVEVAGLKKGLFFNFSSEHITLRRSGGPLISIDDFTAGINPMSLFIMKLSVHFKGGLGGGSMDGSADIFRSGNLINLRVEDTNIEGIPLFSSVGLDGTGTFSGELFMKNGDGDAKFRLKDTRLKNRAFGGITLPLDMFSEAKGAVSINKQETKIIAFSMEGDGIYARLSGNIKGNAMDMLMELMPQKSFIEKNPVMLMLGNYRVSPGHYSVPVKTTMPF